MKRYYLLLFLISCANLLLSQQKKEFDYDINYDESKVPHYQIPALLESSTGQKINTQEAWKNQRRPEILSLFSNLVYGENSGP